MVGWLLMSHPAPWAHFPGARVGRVGACLDVVGGTLSSAHFSQDTSLRRAARSPAGRFTSSDTSYAPQGWRARLIRRGGYHPCYIVRRLLSRWGYQVYRSMIQKG